jgi:hypothetical protein
METRYGHLTVVDPTDHRGNIDVRCDCGTVKTVRRRSLLAGHLRSCGCQQNTHRIGTHWRTHELAPDHSPIVEIGARFGRLTVTSDPTPKGKRRVVDVTCDCGTTKTGIGTDNLRAGLTRSCGCLNRDAAPITPTKHTPATQA